MKMHANARLSLKGRELLIDRVENAGWSLIAAAEAAGISDRTARKWLARYRTEGADGLVDRSSAPVVVANRTQERRVEVIAALRRLADDRRGDRRDPRYGALDRVRDPDPDRDWQARPARPGAGATLRTSSSGRADPLDVKKLGRIGSGAPGTASPETAAKATAHAAAGWEFVHVCIDDATRLAYVEVLADERATTAVGFLRRAVRQYAAYGITVERLLTDNGNAYRSAVHAIACRALGIRHLRTRPYRPQTNGKAERFIRTMLGGWAYGAIYRAANEVPLSPAGWTSTIAADHTAPSATGHP